MEIKIDANNPVMIQRAREQLEEAEKRADALKTLGGPHGLVPGVWQGSLSGGVSE